MNLLAYLLALGNIQSLQASGGPIKDLSIQLGDLQTLRSELLTSPEFDLDKFKETGFYRVGYIGKYLSKNLRDFMYQGLGHPNDEAVVLTIYFNNDNFLHDDSVGDEVRAQLDEYLGNNSVDRQRRSLVDILKT